MLISAQDLNISELLLAAKAVVERWDSPLWKDQSTTAEYIDALRKAIDKL